MANQRSVRFAGTTSEESLYPPPVFSPTAEQDESVLHSIFSPTARERGSGVAKPVANSERTNGFFSSQPPPTSHISPRGATGALRSQSYSNRQFQGTSRAFAPSTSKTPSPRSTQLIADNGRESPTSTIISNDVFYSPASSLDMTSPRSVLSAKSQKSSSSFGALRDVTLLDLDNIKKCNSVDDLENVIQVLTGEGKFQALLRMAKGRLESILGSAGLGDPPKPEEESKPKARSTFFSSQPKPSNFFQQTEIYTTGKTTASGMPTFRFFQQNDGPTTSQSSYSHQPEIRDATRKSERERHTSPFFRAFGSQKEEEKGLTVPSTAPRPPDLQVSTKTSVAELPIATSKPSPRRVPRSPSYATNNVQPTTNRLTPTNRDRLQGSNSPVNAHFGIQIDSLRTSSRNESPIRERGSAPEEGPAALNETNESSLLMSVSTSVLEANLDEFNLRDPPNPQHAIALANSRSYIPLNVDTKRLSGNYGYLSPSPSSSRFDRELSEDIKKLTETVVAMENSRKADREMFLDKLTSLEDQKKTVQTMASEASASMRELLSSMQHLRDEGLEIQESLRAEHTAWSKCHAEAQERERRLSVQAEEVAKLVSACSQNGGKEAEERLLQKYEALLRLKQKDNEDLNRYLRDLLGNLLVGLGRNKNELLHMTKQDQQELVLSFAHMSLSATAARESLGHELAKLEQERREAKDEVNALKLQLEQSAMARKQQELEHRRILGFNEDLKNELAKREKDNFTQERTVELWTQQEKQYMNMIQNLKAQLGKPQDKTMVSVGLYKAAVDEKKKKASEVQEKQREVDALKARYSNATHRLLESEKKHSISVASSLDHVKEKKESEKKISELQSQLREEQQRSRQALDKANQEKNELRRQMEDIKFESIENGGDFGSKPRTKSPTRTVLQPTGTRTLLGPRSITPSPRNRLMQTPSPSQQMTPKKPTVKSITPTPAKTLNKENAAQTPNVRGKRFNFVQKAGGRKGLRDAVQRMRSPKARQTLKM